SFDGPTLNAGTYWINLQNASVNSGDPIYWDENSGPSSASENSIGTIPSESFTVFGSLNTTSTTCGCCGSGVNCVAEPSTITLSTSGVLTIFGLLGAVRSRFSRR